jgi:hypothetical protein
VTPNNAFERTVGHRGPRLAAARSSWPPLNSVVRSHVTKVVETPITAEMIATVRSRIGDLRAKSFSELAALPERETRSIDVSGKAASLSTYRISRSSDELLIVVQVYRSRFLGLSEQIRAEGFIASSTGEITQAPEQLLWDHT